MKQITLLLFLLIPSLALGSTIQGTVYDLGLTPTESVVTISTTPAQRAVTEEGKYSFNVSRGTYTLVAVEQQGNTIIAQANETITINNEGTYRVDIILYPTADLEDKDIPDAQDINDLWGNTGRNYTSIILGICLAILVFGIITWIVLRKKPQTTDDELSNVLDYIRKEKRTTQKDIRKAFPHSEAKISLALTQLEKEGKIAKIKKGRGNVITHKKG